ncbi:VOC family protein [Aeromicrobium sp.]|uniref:VOC family protein n=1 Tax=Aeromicrobium sp. TaxID=1871063 RepID=UPI002FCB88B1
MSDAPPLAGYHHLGITVRDIGTSEAWYTQTLGLVRAFVEQHDNETGYARVLTRPGTPFFLGLDHHEDADRLPFDARRTGLDHFALAVTSAEEVHAWAAHFDALDVDHEPVLEASEPVPLAMVLLRDPDGIVIELIWTGA